MDVTALLRELDIKALFAGAALALTLRELFAKALTERRRKAAFVGVSLEHNGERIHLVWGGPIGTLTENPDPFVVAAELQARLTHAIEQQFPGEYQVMSTHLEDTRGVLLYRTDADKTWKRRLRSEDARYYLFVARRR
jgi:hypothetical protein